MSHLNINFNGLDIILPKEQILANFPKLQYLNLRGNNVTLDAPQNTSGNLYVMFKYLTYLDASSSNVRYVPDNYFLDCNFVSDVALDNNYLNESNVINILNGLLNVKI